MNQFPTTRSSLVLRIRNPRDERAWSEFVEIYEPLIYRIARKRGFQDADAKELTQQVLMAVASAAGRFDPSSEKGSFRGWLFRITRNLIVNYVTRERRHLLGSGDSGVYEMLQEVPSRSLESEEFDEEYSLQVFEWAAEQVKKELRAATWDAFWLTSVEGWSVDAVAAELGMTRGAVYVARSRTMARLREKIDSLEHE